MFSRKKDLDGTPHSVSCRGEDNRQMCKCLHCSQYQAKFKPTVHPCPNFKKKGMAGPKKAKKAPKKVITSRWVHPPKFDSQGSFPPCRCMPSSAKAPTDQSESSDGGLSSSASLGREESKMSDSKERKKKERQWRKDFYDALEKQAEKTSDQPAGSSKQTSNAETRRDSTRAKKAAGQRESQLVGRTQKVPEKAMGRNDEIVRKSLPRSVSQASVSSGNSTYSDVSRSSSAKLARHKSPERKSGGKVLGTSSPVQNSERKKLSREAAKPADPNLRSTGSTVSFSLSPDVSATKLSRTSQSSTRSRGLLKDPRSTTVRSNSARLFLEEEQLRKLQETVEKSLSPEVADSNLAKKPIPQQLSRKAMPVTAMGAPDSSVGSEEPTSNSRLVPSRQFMNIFAQESAKKKLIARARAAQGQGMELDSTDLFGMESRHYEVLAKKENNQSVNQYEVLSIERKVNGCMWGIRAYRPC